MMPTTFPDISNKICINQTNEAESRQLCLTLKRKKENVKRKIGNECSTSEFTK